MIVDCVTFNGENDLFDLRYNILKDHVDQFRVIEFDKTFSGKPKEKSFTPPNGGHKILYYFVPEGVWGGYMELAKSSPNARGAEHFKTEFCQKESIKDCLTDLKDDDILFIGDCDEIWENISESDVDYWEKYGFKEFKLKLRVYSYYLNNKSSEEFYGTLVTKYGNVKDSCLNHLRTTPYRTQEYRGWHFTSLRDGLRKKLTDSYTEESYPLKIILDELDDNIDNNRDFLITYKNESRNFTYGIDESEWPAYLQANRDKYKHLCK